MPSGLFVELYKLILKFIGKRKYIRIIKDNF